MVVDANPMLSALLGGRAREIFDPREVSVCHCINRCIPTCFLCGYDPWTGIDYDHCKIWIEQRLQFRAGCWMEQAATADGHQAQGGSRDVAVDRRDPF